MKYTDLNWEIVNETGRPRHIYPLHKRFCDNISSCCQCSKRVRFWCAVIVKIRTRQESIITKILNKKQVKEHPGVLAERKGCVK